MKMFKVSTRREKRIPNDHLNVSMLNTYILCKQVKKVKVDIFMKAENKICTKNLVKYFNQLSNESLSR